MKKIYLLLFQWVRIGLLTVSLQTPERTGTFSQSSFTVSLSEKPPLDGGNHPSGQLLPLPSIRSSLPVGRLRRQPVPVPRSHPTPLSRRRNISEILDFFGVDVPSFLQQKHRFPSSGRCVFVCLSCHVDYGRKAWNRGFI